jgi:hypothetical protein
MICGTARLTGTQALVRLSPAQAFPSGGRQCEVDVAKDRSWDRRARAERMIRINFGSRAFYSTTFNALQETFCFFVLGKKINFCSSLLGLSQAITELRLVSAFFGLTHEASRELSLRDKLE